MYSILIIKDTDRRACIAKYLRNIICTPEGSKIHFFDKALQLMKDSHPYVQLEAIQIIGYYRIHTKLSLIEQSLYLDIIKEATLSHDTKIAKQAVPCLQALILKPDELEEVQITCFNSIFNLLQTGHINEYVIETLGILSKKISTWNNEFWKVCIDINQKKLPKGSAVKSLGHFAMLCADNQEIFSACFDAIMECKLSGINDQPSTLAGLGMLMRSSGIKPKQIEQCITQINSIAWARIFGNEKIIISELKETAQFWYQNIDIMHLLINYMQELFLKKEFQKSIIDALDSLTQIPDLNPSLRECCLLAILDGLTIDLNGHQQILYAVNQSMMKSLKNNQVSSNIVEIYLQFHICRLRNLMSDNLLPNEDLDDFINICLFYENHQEYLTSHIMGLIEESKKMISLQLGYISIP